MLKVRRKIFLYDCILAVVLTALLYPIVCYFVEPGNIFRVLLLSLSLLLLHRIIGLYFIMSVLRPINQIYSALKNFTVGKEELFPQIVLKGDERDEEFNKLAYILNALTGRIQRQVANLQKQQEETKEILESLGEGIIALDPSAKVTFINQTAKRMLQCNSSIAPGCTLHSLGVSDLIEKCHELVLHALQTAEPISFTKRGTTYLEVTAAPLAHRDGALLVIQDKTSDYKMIEMGKDFVANASHELRTPITIIRGFAETLQDIPKLSKKMQEQIIEKIVRTCGRLDKLVRSLLTLSDVENISENRLKPVDLIPLLENCMHFIETSNPKAEVQLKTPLESVIIMADADLLELAVLNILENGARYSAKDAKLAIHVEKSKDQIFLHLRDEGIGIPESDLERIFDRFYTVDKARSRKSGGTGLGLSIVKTIIEKHKGKILSKSEIGKGSTFTFVFPLKILS